MELKDHSQIPHKENPTAIFHSHTGAHHDCDCAGHRHHHLHVGECPCCSGAETLQVTMERGAGAWFRANLTWLLALLIALPLYVFCQCRDLEPEFAAETAWIVWGYLTAYALAALPVLRGMWHRLCNGEVFNEFLLMAIVTAGAFALGEYSEAVTVMVFYRIGMSMQNLALNRAKIAIRETLAAIDDGGAASREPSPAVLAAAERAIRRKSNAQQFITRFARYYTPAMVVIALIALLLPVAPEAGEMAWKLRLLNGMTFLLIACPCALVISIPLGYFGGIGLAGKAGILFKGAYFLDLAAKIDLVLFDPQSAGASGPVQKAVALLQREGIDCAVLTELAEPEAQAWAQRVGITEVHAALSPETRLEAVSLLKKSGAVAAYAGFTAADAPTLAVASVGFGFGKLPIEAASTADVVIREKDPALLLQAIRCGKWTRQVVFQNIALVLAIKMLVIALVLTGVAGSNGELWEAVFADVGAALLAIGNAIRLQRKRLD